MKFRHLRYSSDIEIRRSIKDTVKALHNAFSDPRLTTPLPEELRRILDGFLDRYHEIDDHESQRLQEELLSIYRKYVVDKPDNISSFVSVLRQLRPAVIGETRLIEWWHLVIRPVVDGIGHTRRTIEDASEFVQSVLDYDADDDTSGEKERVSNALLKRVLDAYIGRSKVLPVHAEGPSPEDDYIRTGLEAIVINFGRKKPKVGAFIVPRVTYVDVN
jgi:hypothetical protein